MVVGDCAAGEDCARAAAADGAIEVGLEPTTGEAVLSVARESALA